MAKQHSARAWRMLTINGVWFGVSFLWNSVHPILLPMLLGDLTQTSQNTYFGLLTFVGLIVALMVQPISGAFSDRTVHHLGRRRPWMLMGLCFGLVCLWGMALSRSLWELALSYVLLQFFSNLLHGPAQGLIPDLVPAGQRGVASGIKSLIDMLGVVAAALTVSRLMGGQLSHTLLAIGVVSVVWLGATLWTVVGADEPSPAGTRGPRLSVRALLRDVFALQVHAHGDYARLLLARFCVLLGTYMVQSFAYFILADGLHLANPARAVGNIQTMIGLSLMVAAVPAGWLSEHYGRKRLSLVAEVIVAVGLTGLAATHSATTLAPLGCLIGLGMGIFTSVNWAWATDLVPPDEAAKYLGLSNLATAGTSATSRLAGPIIDAVNARLANGGYLMLLLLAIVSVLVAIPITSHIDKERRMPV